MCRPISVDPLSFHQLQRGGGGDSTRTKFDSTKADQEGAKVGWKNVYDNTHNPVISTNLSMGCYLAFQNERFIDTQFIFRNKSAKSDSASQCYCTQLMHIARKAEHDPDIREYMRSDRLTVYGFRKGAAVKCNSNTADCAPIVSVLNRGEWSAGKVFDSYFHWANGGDEYVGRCVRGVSPSEKDFALLPPHWNVEGPVLKN